ncbi:hypothetical protein [Bradyrhizobium sp. ARR65]|uniref:hypothetical protein n=1 Tax=Bradyrhizobium sp. ARR65 TaxID=1040989 RepID=UPI000AC69057|nr:hypothetical protein [Bradyrhizobium sp. ARR65]
MMLIGRHWEDGTVLRAFNLPIDSMLAAVTLSHFGNDITPSESVRGSLRSWRSARGGTSIE